MKQIQITADYYPNLYSTTKLLVENRNYSPLLRFLDFFISQGKLLSSNTTTDEIIPVLEVQHG